MLNIELSLHQLQTVILTLSICILILIFLLKKKFTENFMLKQYIQKLDSSLRYNFEGDTEFLLYIIGFKCQIYANREFNTQIELTQNKLLAGTLLDDAVAVVAEDVYNSLSPMYRNILSKYFTETSLKEYIVEIVLDSLLKICKNINSTKIKDMYTDKSTDRKAQKSPYFRKSDIE